VVWLFGLLRGLEGILGHSADDQQIEKAGSLKVLPESSSLEFELQLRPGRPSAQLEETIFVTCDTRWHEKLP
jgi:hypothetical protein